VKKQTFADLLCSFVAQLYSKSPECRKPLDGLFDRCFGGGDKPESKALSATFHRMLSRSSSVLIVIDALDECTTREELISWLANLSNSLNAKTNILIASRAEQDIAHAIKSWMGESNIIPIPKDAVDIDIRAYIRDELRTARKFQRWNARPEIIEKIEVELMKKAGGMYEFSLSKASPYAVAEVLKIGIGFDGLPVNLTS
jgi:hypothetical protein